MLLLEFNKKYYNVDFLKLLSFDAPRAANLFWDFFEKKGYKFKQSDKERISWSTNSYKRKYWFARGSDRGVGFSLLKNGEYSTDVRIKIEELTAIVEIYTANIGGKRFKININNLSVKDFYNKINEKINKIKTGERDDDVPDKGTSENTLKNVANKHDIYLYVSERGGQVEYSLYNKKTGIQFGKMASLMNHLFDREYENFDSPESLTKALPLIKYIIYKMKNKKYYLIYSTLGGFSRDRALTLKFSNDSKNTNEENELYSAIKKEIKDMENGKEKLFRLTVKYIFEDKDKLTTIKNYYKK